jgi:hypothetical protein
LWNGESNTFSWQYERILRTVCDVALFELPENVVSLLEILAFLNPDEIPETVLLDSCQVQFLQFLNLDDKDE